MNVFTVQESWALVFVAYLLVLLLWMSGKIVFFLDNTEIILVFMRLETWILSELFLASSYSNFTSYWSYFYFSLVRLTKKCASLCLDMWVSLIRLSLYLSTLSFCIFSISMTLLRIFCFSLTSSILICSYFFSFSKCCLRWTLLIYFLSF